MPTATAPEIVAQTLAGLDRSTERLLRLLSAVPDDKLSWQPSSTARSALALVAHCGLVNRAFASLIAGRMRVPMPPPEAFAAEFQRAEAEIVTREGAIALLNDSAAELREVLNAVDAETLDSTPDSPFGPLPMTFWLDQCASHPAGHARQLEYLQTIWGDLDPHMS